MRCLEKEPNERFESARDVAFALETLSSDRVSSQPVRAIRSPRLGRSLRAAMIGAVAFVALLIVGQKVQKWLAPPPVLPDLLHVGVPRFLAPGDDIELQQLADGLSKSVAEGLVALEPRAAGDLWVVPQRRARIEGAVDCEGLFRISAVWEHLKVRYGV